MWHKRITSDDILRGNVKLPRRPFNYDVYTASDSRYKNWGTRLFLSVSLVIVLFLSLSFFFPDAIKDHHLFALFCITVISIFSVHFLYMLGALDVALVSGELIELIGQIIIDALWLLF